MKVYIVTYGYYSDQSVAAVFSSKEKADQFIRDTQAKGLVDYHHTFHNEFEVDRGVIEWFEGHGTFTERHREVIKLY